MKNAMRVLVAMSVLGACTTDPDGDSKSGGDTDGMGGDADNMGDTFVPVNGTVELAETCTAVTPCGGDLAGTWQFEHACYVRTELLADLYQACPTAVVSNVATVTATGTATFAAGNMTRNIHTELTGDVAFPSACNNGCNCSLLALGLSMAGIPTECDAACDASSNCICHASFAYDIEDTATYSTSGNTATLSTGETYDYCVSGSTLTYKETSATNADPGYYRLTK